MAASPAHVIRVELARDAAEIRKQRFSAFQRSRVPVTAAGTLDASRVVVVGSPEEMRAEADALARVIGAQSVERVICVVRGTASLEYEAAFELPIELDLAPVAAIWVDDPRGVLWAMRTAKAQALTVYDGDPDGDTAFDLLIESLRLPEVFDDVFGKTEEIGTLVSPALRVFVPGATDSKLNEAAEVAAVTALTSGGRPNLEISIDEVPGDLESRSSLFGQAPVPAEFFDAQGKVGRLSREIASRLIEVDAAVEAITERPPLRHRPIEHANEAIRAVGAALGELNTELVRLFNDIDGTNGLDAEEVKKLRSVGLRSGTTKVVRSDTPDEAETLLRSHALSELRRTRSLKEVISELRLLEERATPRTPKQTVAMLDEAAPRETIERISSHPPLRVPISDWRSLILIAAMFAGAGLMWVWAGLLIAVSLGALFLFFFLITHPLSDLRGLSQAGLKEAAKVREVYLVLGAAIVGSIVGEAIQGGSGGTPLHVSGTGVAVGAFCLLALNAWRSASRRWLDAANLGGAREAGQRMLEVTATVAMNDWILAEPRVRFASVAGKLAASLEALRVALLAQLAPGLPSSPSPSDEKRGAGTKEAADGAPRAPGQQPTGCNPAVRADISEVRGGALYRHSAKLEEIVLHDYLDAIAHVVEEHWPQIALGDQHTGEGAVVGGLGERLSWYRSDLAQNGLFGARWSFEDRDLNALSLEGRQRRRELLAELWESFDLDSLVGYAPDAQLVQFCSAESLVLLNQDPAVAAVTRFAPAGGSSARMATDVVRTASMLMAGVLRLVPLRNGTVAFGDVDAPSLLDETAGSVLRAR